MYLRVNKIISESAVEGPGKRFVLWVQGCPVRCPECANKETWAFDGGRKIKLSEIIYQIHTAKNIEGITILGGEPFSQAKKLYYLIKKIKGNKLSVILFTGYTYDYLKKNGNYFQKKLLNSADLLIDGPFIKEKLDFSRPLTGSENQNYYFFTKKIKPEEFFKIKNKIEVYIDHNGLVQINGMGDIEKIRNLIRVKNKQKEEL